jgi:enoyl-CoA hydratase
MSGTIVHDGDVLVREERALRHITLNRPKALNALTLDMARTITAFLRAWAADPKVGTVLLDGAGERGFCAGGDIRALYDAAKAGSSLPAQFWSTEYHLDVLIARYRKPIVVIMDGLVMGGGVGLSVHAAHRVVTERSVVAMPEVGIGYFPDVGASFVFSRAPGSAGTHLMLTGERMNAADAIYCGAADVNIPAAKLHELVQALAECRTAEEVRAQLDSLSASPPAGKLPIARQWIDRCYSANNVEAILNQLQAEDEGDAPAALDALRQASPTSLKITLRNVSEARSFNRVEESFQQDYRVSLACIAGHDFIEGIRAQIVDKDRKPVWRPEKLADVTPHIVDRHFRSVRNLELKFEN